jgi:threonylcarbamoyladenosine tRNA methylthiotransferase MtaB
MSKKSFASVSLHTLGCKLNYSETSTLAKQFETRGIQLKRFGEKSDIFVLNTCTVTDNADKECRRIIRSVIRNNPDTYIVITGCYAQLQPGDIAAIEGVDLILGSQEKFKLFDYLEKSPANFDSDLLPCVFKKSTVEPKTKIFVSEIKGTDGIGEAFSADTDSRTRAFLKIQDGCDYSCSFCTIPLARGSSRSLHADKVIENAQRIIDAGYKEIILTGVNTGDYKYTEGINGAGSVYKFIDVLYKLEKLDIKRIRISSIEPNLLTDEIIQLVKSSDKFCNHFHIPLQSGDSDILKLMKRRYNPGFFGDLIHKLNEEIENAGIGIDVIAGFPGESDVNFGNTYNFIDALPVSYLHVFGYSERRNTPAAAFQGKVDVKVRKERSMLLRNLSEKKRSVFYSRFAGTEQSVLFESGQAKSGNEYIEGFTGNYIRVITKINPEGRPDLQNEIRKVRLSRTFGRTLGRTFSGVNGIKAVLSELI